MDYLNPIAPSVLQSSVAQRQASASKNEQLHRSQQKRRLTGTSAQDTGQPPVESVQETPDAAQERQKEHPRGKRQRRGYCAKGRASEEEAPRLDLRG